MLGCKLLLLLLHTSCWGPLTSPGGVPIDQLTSQCHEDYRDPKLQNFIHSNQTQQNKPVETTAFYLSSKVIAKHAVGSLQKSNSATQSAVRWAQEVVGSSAIDFRTVFRRETISMLDITYLASFLFFSQIRYGHTSK